MFLKFRIIEFTDESTGLTFANNHWFDTKNIETFSESNRFGTCLKISVDLDIRNFYSDSYTGEQLAVLINEDEERINDYDV